VARFLESIGQRKPVGVRYFCDASVLAHGGIPSVVFGPGDIAQAHTADEWISVEALERGKRLLRRYLQSLS
jgi:acetylornithine deacetylase